jgi:hypothetical protein
LGPGVNRLFWPTPGRGFRLAAGAAGLSFLFLAGGFEAVGIGSGVDDVAAERQPANENPTSALPTMLRSDPGLQDGLMRRVPQAADFETACARRFWMACFRPTVSRFLVAQASEHFDVPKSGDPAL